MAITRTPEQMALTETSRLCQEIVDLCRDAVEQRADLAVLQQLIEDHRRARVLVDTRLGELDDLPLTPDPDWEALRKLAVRTKKIFASDETAVLLEERIADENKLLTHVADALAGNLDPRTRACLVEVQRIAAHSKRAAESELATRRV
jgi:hypothetical protein